MSSTCGIHGKVMPTLLRLRPIMLHHDPLFASMAVLLAALVTELPFGHSRRWNKKTWEKIGSAARKGRRVGF